MKYRAGFPRGRPAFFWAAPFTSHKPWQSVLAKGMFFGVKKFRAACLILSLALNSPLALANKKHSTHAAEVPAATPVPHATHGPSPTPSPVATLAPAAGKTMLREFQRAQGNELKAADHQAKSATKELKASQAARQKEWERTEKEARHKFFAEHAAGAERRTYIHDFLDRRKSFLQLLSDEAAQRAHERDVHLQSLKEDQASRLKEFQAALDAGHKPEDRLWPTTH